MAPYVAIGFVQAIGIALLGVAMQTPNVEMPMRDLLSDRFSLILVGTFAVTLGPACEELAFRGFLLPVLARTFGGPAGVTLTSATFALMHGPQYAWSWQHLVLICLAGVLFGAVRLLSGSTAAAAAMHAGYNLTFFVAYLTQWEEFTS
jgi:membrane protease YdiL (CAAX protease family)